MERRNVGLATNAAGKAVRFGTPGEPDYSCVVPVGPSRGRHLAVEIKHSEFDPRRLRGKAAEHFARQLAAMRAINDAGGLAFWLRDGADAVGVFKRIVEASGLTVEIDQFGLCWLHVEDLP